MCGQHFFGEWKAGRLPQQPAPDFVTKARLIGDRPLRQSRYVLPGSCLRPKPHGILARSVESTKTAFETRNRKAKWRS
jgi:hypothetical protein